MLATTTTVAMTLALAPSFERPPQPQEIVGGSPTAPGEFEGVVALFVGANVCSGTLIAPRIVLTAAHCLDGLYPEEVAVDGGMQANRSDAIEAIAVGVHPDYCRTCDRSDPDLFDYGYVELPVQLDVTELVSPLWQQQDWDAMVHAGAEVVVVGYGEDETGLGGIKRKVTTQLQWQSESGQEFFAGGDFRDSCFGDSGGPAFVRLADGSHAQVGVVSRGGSPCGDGGVYAVPYPALAWIEAETSVTLCGSACGDCACVDTSPPPVAGCGCKETNDSTPVFAVLVLLLGIALRPRD